MSVRVFSCCFLVAFLVFSATPGLADSESPPPEGTVLTVSGNIAGAKPVYLDMAAIRKLPAVRFSTYDPWDKRQRTYTGPLITDVLALAGAGPASTEIDVIASNDYEISINISDMAKIGHILSYQMDGLVYAKHNKPGNKGPLAVAINFDENDIEMEIFKHQLAWLVKKIVIR